MKERAVIGVRKYLKKIDNFFVFFLCYLIFKMFFTQDNFTLFYDEKDPASH